MLVTPSPAPGVGESPLMTWGRLDATPLRLDPFAADDPPLDVAAAAGGRAFHIAAPRKRGASVCALLMMREISGMLCAALHLP